MQMSTVTIYFVACCCGLLVVTKADSFHADSFDYVVTDNATDPVTETGLNCTLPSISHGHVRDVTATQWSSVSNETWLSSRIEIVCDDGFRFPHIKSFVVHIVCQPDGTWTDLLGTAGIPTCERIGGCALLQFAHSYISDKASGYMPGDYATMHCQAGYVLAPHGAHPVIFCNADGSWATINDVVLSCQLEYGCLTPATVLNGGYHMTPADARDGVSARWRSGVRALAYCDNGYRLSSDSALVLHCDDGRWVGSGSAPECVQRQVTDRCSSPADIAHARRYVLRNVVDAASERRAADAGTVPHGTKVMYVCDAGYRQVGSSTTLCEMGQWTGHGPTCLQQGCTAILPHVANAEWSVYPQTEPSSASDAYRDGTHVYYFCLTGYRLAQQNASALVCRDQQWTGQMPACVVRDNCDAPMDIENGNWIIESLVADYRAGVRIKYKCDNGFNLVGAQRIHCLSTGYWSDYPPKCLVKEEYCSEPASIDDGFYMCKPSQCDLFRVGTELHYFCNSNYELEPTTRSVSAVCLPGGVWSTMSTPTCLQVETAASSQYLPSHKTLVVLISTTCSILSVLIVVLSVVIVQHYVRRRRHRATTCSTASAADRLAPPSATCPQVTASTEHDRLALIAFADDLWPNAPLPTYEEAMLRPSVDYVNLHSAATTSTSPGASAAGDQRRNSIVTTGSSSLSAAAAVAGFGSIDTVNNAASETTSTSVTVDTYDSLASNRSLTPSQRAARGSLESSSTIANDAAMPLLQHEDLDAGETPSHTSLSEATSRIVELPEDIKDD